MLEPPLAEEAFVKLSRSLLVFSVAFTFFQLSPAYLPYSAPPHDLLRVGDLLDLCTPLVLLPLYALLLWHRHGGWPGWPKMILFLVLLAAWGEGHSLHLAANALGHLIVPQASSPAWRLDYFLDEHLSHIIWHSAIILLSLVLLNGPLGDTKVPTLASASFGLPYGFSFFAITVEGQTPAIGILAALSILVWLGSRWKNRKGDALSVFFASGYLLALLLYFVWYLMQGGLPQFSEVGLIK